MGQAAWGVGSKLSRTKAGASFFPSKSDTKPLITPDLASRGARGFVYNDAHPAGILGGRDRNAMLDWIKKRAAEARKHEKYSRWKTQKARLIELHSQEYFVELSALMAKSVTAFNAEFEEPERQIDSFEPGLNRFVLERKSNPAVRVECRLDQVQRPPPEAPGRLQKSRANCPNRPAAHRGGG